MTMALKGRVGSRERFRPTCRSGPFLLALASLLCPTSNAWAQLVDHPEVRAGIADIGRRLTVEVSGQRFARFALFASLSENPPGAGGLFERAPRAKLIAGGLGPDADTLDSLGRFVLSGRIPDRRRWVGLHLGLHAAVVDWRAAGRYLSTKTVTRTIGTGSRGDFRARSISLPAPFYGATLDGVVGDVDGDGDLDVIVSYYKLEVDKPGQERLYLNDGVGGFVDSTAGATAYLPQSNDLTEALALADFDGDGDLDLFVANANASGEANQSRILLNDGQGGFTDVTLGPPRRVPLHSGQAISDVATGDVDKDGDLDVLVTSGSSIGSELLINRGDAFFANEIVRRVPDATPESWGWGCGPLFDVDRDGDLDFIRAGVSIQPQLLINDGSGFFSDGLSVPGTGLPYLKGRIAARSAAVGDVDGDDDLDLVLASNNIIGGEPGALPFDRLLINDGHGLFTDGTFSPGTGLPAIAVAGHSIAMGDVDRDGDLDIVVGKGFDKDDKLYLNDGRGLFSDATYAQESGLPYEGEPNNRIVFADFDGDGNLDLLMTRFAGRGQPNVILFND